MNTQDQDLTVPMDHPTIAAVAGWVHRTFFQPIDDLIDRLTAKSTEKFVNDRLSKK